MPRQGGIPLPSRGIVSKIRSTASKTTVRSKRVGPLGRTVIVELGESQPLDRQISNRGKGMVSHVQMSINCGLDFFVN